MGSLDERLREIRAQGEAKRDAATNAVMHRATDELRSSGIAERVAKVGDAAPPFARPNLEGDTVRLQALLRRGPVVLSFFRGRW